MDLAVANDWSNNVSVFLNNGDGTFSAKTDYTAGDHPISVFSSDLDGDGDMDLAVAIGGDYVSVLLNFNEILNPPQNLTATPGPAAAGQVTLRWSPNTESDLHKYNIYRDTSSPAITLVDSCVAS